MPLVSICIPTRNRSKYLAMVLDSIVSQVEFYATDEIEIVVSDNCSTDDTQEICSCYIKQFPAKIFYYRTDRNIGFDNFRKVLSLARGVFCKLNNDTLIHKAGSLSKILTVVREEQLERKILFFPNGSTSMHSKNAILRGVDDFLGKVSYQCTWIGAFGVWQQELKDVLVTLDRERKTEIPHVIALFDFLVQGRPARICNEFLFDSLTPVNKGGYNIAEVFGNNYLSFLEKMIDQGLLSRKIYDKEKKRILPFINRFYFDRKKKFAFRKTGYFKWMFPFYWRNYYFYIKLIGVFNSLLKSRMRMFCNCFDSIG